MGQAVGYWDVMKALRNPPKNLMSCTIKREIIWWQIWSYTRDKQNTWSLRLLKASDRKTCLLEAPDSKLTEMI